MSMISAQGTFQTRRLIPLDLAVAVAKDNSGTYEHALIHTRAHQEPAPLDTGVCRALIGAAAGLVRVE